MSAIFGIHYLDDRPVPRSYLERMSGVLAHRGSDGTGLWCEGTVGLGQRMLWTTPESVQESLPFQDSSGDYAITADARLDNRDELISLLIPSRLDLKGATDSELILEAYRQWGECCPEKLLGDFAFAIWDKRQRILFCARDHFGVRPFYYYSSPTRAFVFASEMKAVFALSEVPYELNEVRIGDHLADVFVDDESTFYRGILRLPPAHSMTVSRDRVSTRRYFVLDEERELHLGSDDEYAEAFRELFTKAVSCRLHATGSVGVMLSGGLDSSSITCVAKKLLPSKSNRLKTFSTIFDAVPECDEREFINPILKECGVDPHFITGNQQGPFKCLDTLHRHQDQPSYGPNFAMIWSVYESVGEQKVRVLLDGHDGDTTVSHGERYLHELAQSGHWLNLTTELRAISKHRGGSAWEDLNGFAWQYGIKPSIEKHKALRLARQIWRSAAHRTKGGSGGARPRRDLLNPRFASQINMSQRYQEWRQTTSRTGPTEREAHYRRLTHPIQAFALELHDTAAAAFSIEKRYPFWDKRLVEFCLALPAHQKLNNGWSRVVLRRGMNGILPPQIQWRPGKTNFVPSLEYGLRVFEREQLDKIILHNPGVIEEYVNINLLRKAYGRFLDPASEVAPTDLFAIWKAVTLASWLQQAW